MANADFSGALRIYDELDAAIVCHLQNFFRTREVFLRASALSVEDNQRELQSLRSEILNLNSAVVIRLHHPASFISSFSTNNAICTLLEAEYKLCYSLLQQFRAAGASMVAINEELSMDTAALLTAYSVGRRIDINRCIAFCSTNSGRPLRQPSQM